MTWSTSLVVVHLLACCLSTTHAFSSKLVALVSPSAQGSVSTTLRSVLSTDDFSHYRRRQSSTTRLNYVPSSDDENNLILPEQQRQQDFTTKSTTNQEEEEWTMAEDWELMDQLSKFTVGEGVHCRTFWTQMAACTPILSSRTPKALFHRCQYLHQQQNENDSTLNQETSTTAATTSRPPPSCLTIPFFGPSPPVLSQWSIDDNDSSSSSSWDTKQPKNKNAMVGQLQDGRTIWLHYHCIGRLQGDPLSDVTSPSVLQLIPGGYVEAIGGRIYELGEASAQAKQRISSFTTVPPLVDHHAAATAAESSELKKGESLDWLLPPLTASVSAFLACTVLSACIGYGAGLSIIADDHHHSNDFAPAATRPSGEPTTTPNTIRESPSLGEQKARTEYRILKEQRLLKGVMERLEQDQKELLELQQKGIY